jgi:3-hydroxyacyl-[acyl-carrier-protein] dehydratase
MTLKSLYQINDLKKDEGNFSASLSFNSGHEIFNGHFPGQPVVPGVALIHILKDLCSRITGYEVKLVKGTNIKFLNIIDPTNNASYSISGTFSQKEDNSITLTASIRNKDSINIKFRGTFSKTI